MKAFIRLVAAICISLFALTTAHAEEKTAIKIGTLSWEDQLGISMPTAKFLEIFDERPTVHLTFLCTIA